MTLGFHVKEIRGVSLFSRKSKSTIKKIGFHQVVYLFSKVWESLSSKIGDYEILIVGLIPGIKGVNHQTNDWKAIVLGNRPSPSNQLTSKGKEKKDSFYKKRCVPIRSTRNLFVFRKLRSGPRSNRSPNFVVLECFLDRPWTIFHGWISPTAITHEKNMSENHRSEPNLPGNFMEPSRGVLDFRGVLLPQSFRYQRVGRQGLRFGGEWTWQVLCQWHKKPQPPKPPNRAPQTHLHVVSGYGPNRITVSSRVREGHGEICHPSRGNGCQLRHGCFKTHPETFHRILVV